jgi:MFS-type transporter involved in bile tolerance (Atg22 family)
MTEPATSLWRHPAFLKLWSAQTISSFGARIAREGLPMTAVLVLKAPPAAMGALAAVGLAAYALVGMAAGVLADRAPRRALMIGADLGRTLVMVAVPAAALLHALSIAGVAVALALMSALTVIFDVADHAFLPSIVDAPQLVDGNAKLAATDAAAEVGGPAVAGLLFGVLSAPIAAGASAFTYLASALFLAALPPQRAAGPAGEVGSFAPLAGFRIVLWHPFVRPIWLMAVVGDFFGWFFGALYILYALQVLRLSTIELGLTIAAGGVGALVGAALTPGLARRLGAGPTIVVTAFALSLTNFLIPLAAGPPLVAMTFLIAGQLFGDAMHTVVDIGETSLRQSLLPSAELGRAAGAFATGRGLAGVAGALIGGALGGLIGPREALLVAAAGRIAPPLIGVASPLWRARAGPAAEA